MLVRTERCAKLLSVLSVLTANVPVLLAPGSIFEGIFVGLPLYLTMITIEKLSSHHNRRDFDCDIEELNSYLQRYSSQHERKGMGRTYVATKEDNPRVLGYYTISSSAVAFDVVPENLPRHPVPVALIGRLAVDKLARGERLGETLLIHALISAQRAAEIVGIYAVIVDAFDESAKNFYLRYGFSELIDDSLHLYLPMKVIERLSLQHKF